MKRFVKGFGLFTAGVAVGGVTAALLTPKTGRSMRKSLRKEVRHCKTSATRLARDVAGDVRSAYDSGRHQVAGKLRFLTRHVA